MAGLVGTRQMTCRLSDATSERGRTGATKKHTAKRLSNFGRNRLMVMWQAVAEHMEAGENFDVNAWTSANVDWEGYLASRSKLETTRPQASPKHAATRIQRASMEEV